MFHDGENGKALMSGRVKIHNGYTSNWKERLQPSITAKGKDLIIVTYSLPHGDSELTRRLITERKGKTVIIYNSKFCQNPCIRYMEKAGIVLIPMDDVHAKMALISPDVVTVGSENFPFSDWYECGISVKDKAAYDYELETLSLYLGFNPLTGEKKTSCSNCDYFRRKYSETGAIIQGDCEIADPDHLENTCEKFKMMDRSGYGLIKEAVATPWKHTCAECQFLSPINNGYICESEGLYFPKIRKFAHENDIHGHRKCYGWTERR